MTQQKLHSSTADHKLSYDVADMSEPRLGRPTFQAELSVAVTEPGTYRCHPQRVSAVSMLGENFYKRPEVDQHGITMSKITLTKRSEE